MSRISAAVRLGKMAHEQDQLPAVLIVIIAWLTPCRHAGPAHAVVNDVIELAIAELLRRCQPHVRRGRIQVPSYLGVTAPVIAVAGSAMISEVPGRFLQHLGRTGERVLAAARRQMAMTTSAAGGPALLPSCWAPAARHNNAATGRRPKAQPPAAERQSIQPRAHETLAFTRQNCSAAARRLSRGALAHAGRAKDAFRRPATGCPHRSSGTPRREESGNRRQPASPM